MVDSQTMLGRAIRVARNIAFRLPDQPSCARYAFILGVPRSGTTLLKSLLVAHSRLGGCDYESTGIFGLRDLYQYRMGDITPEQIDSYLARSSDILIFYNRVSKHILHQKGKELFVDKIQLNRYRIAYVSMMLPNALYINIVRDGRDCFCSAKHHPNVPQAESIKRFAEYWNRCSRTPSRAISSGRLIELRYEDLVEHPEKTLAPIMRFLGYEFEAGQLDVSQYSQTTSIKKTAVHANLAKPVSSSSISRWKRELSSEEIETFHRIASSGLRHYGYGLTTSANPT